MNHAKIVIIVFLLAGLLVPQFGAEKVPFKYPLSKKVDQVDDYFGVKVKDPYRWLEDINSMETTAWITEQKNLTDNYLAGIEFKETFKKRLTEIFNYERYSAPYKAGKYYIFSKNSGLQDQSIVYIQKGLDGEPHILLDPNTFSTAGTITLRSLALSNDQKYVGYSVSHNGSNWRELLIMETESRKKLPDCIRWTKFTSIAWYKDGFFYSRYDEPKEADKLKAKIEFEKVFYHKVGTLQSEDKLIYQDNTNPLLGFAPNVSENEKYLILVGSDGSATYNFLYYKNLETNSAVIPLIDKPFAKLDPVAEENDRFLVITNYEAPNCKLVLIDPLHPEKENWQVIIPESKNKMEYASYVGGKLIVSYLKDANTAVSVYEPGGQKLYDLTLPGIGTALGFGGKKEDNEVFYTFTSFSVPPTIYRYNIKENKSEVFRKAAVKFDPDKFETIQVFYESKDKTRVPMFIVYKKGLLLNGQNPTFLFGYGANNASVRLFFISTFIPLLESGGVYAVPCIRGGGEYGEEWHRAGMLEKKQNTFDDFIAAAEYLIAKGYTSARKLATFGASTGGLLVAAVINQRPDLFQVAFPAMGVLDMLRYQKFNIAERWTKEFGSSDNPEQFKYLYAYSPLHNIKEGIPYPAMLVETVEHDDIVFSAHSFKYIATMQEKYQGKNPILLRFETNVGHGTGYTRTKIIDRYADMLSFMFYNMGITPVFK
ncbi:MAG TPA: prolyl oligopeptidase family serine peptidase [Candidatus Kapabacteria bacterium]|nr:prolyl oligopeptidase family serine peptidase [Candidatus Kapabacteria bacterium]